MLWLSRKGALAINNTCHGHGAENVGSSALHSKLSPNNKPTRWHLALLNPKSYPQLKQRQEHSLQSQPPWVGLQFSQDQLCVNLVKFPNLLVPPSPHAVRNVLVTELS